MRMKLPAARSLLLVLPLLLVNLGGCNLGKKQYLTEPSGTPTPQTNKNKEVSQNISITSSNAVTQQNSSPIASPNATTNTQQNIGTQQNPQSIPSAYAATYAAEAYYQKILAQYGENYQQCLEQVAVELDEVAPSETQEQPSSKQLNVLVALDSSGSTVGTLRGKTKLDIAKGAIANFVNQLPPSAHVGLTVYGHKGSNKPADKAVSCAGIETLYPITQLNNLQFTQALDSFQPTGFTPLAATLELLNQNFSSYDSATNQNVVYVVSDGNENCDGDPVAAARVLHASNAKVIVNVIGLNVNKADSQQLKAVAEAGGGEYFSVRSENQFNQAFESVNNTSQSNRSTVSLVNQNQVSTNIPFDLNRLIVCITIKMNRELGQIISQTTRSTGVNQLNSEYNNYVLNRLRERQDKITAWRNKLQVELSNQQNVNVDKLKQDLAIVTQ